MNTQTIQFQTKKEEKSPQLVLFNSRELAILHKAKADHKTMNKVKDIKHLFHGEVVQYEAC